MNDRPASAGAAGGSVAPYGTASEESAVHGRARECQASRVVTGAWTRRLRPLSGELLSSCLARNALAHGLAPYRFLNMFWQDEPVWNRDFDREPTALARPGRDNDDWLDDVAGKLATARELVEAATLSEWRHIFSADRPSRYGDTSLILSAGVHHRTRIRHGLQYCPACLDEDIPHFRRIWRLAFVVGCPIHRTVLRDACPHCDAPVIPHRTMTMRITDCHACGRSITEGGRDGAKAEAIGLMDDAVAGLQADLLAALETGADGKEPLRARDTLRTVRVLLAVSAARPVRAKLDAALGLPAATDGGDRMRFEHLRIENRARWLATIAAWSGRWPENFRAGAEAAGLTRRSFVRQDTPAGLMVEVRRLPKGQKRDRSWKPVIEDRALMRLRESNPTAYRWFRAERVIEHAMDSNSSTAARCNVNHGHCFASR